MSDDAYAAANVERFQGYADRYNSYRPTPPPELPKILLTVAEMPRARLVVDLGCGTGLSTLVWASDADSVIGIEPSADMRREAEAKRVDGGYSDPITFRYGYSHDTGISDGTADIVTCSQSLHWMEPAATFAEAARILRPGGVFAAYDCDWPPTIPWEAEVAYLAALERAESIGADRRFYSGVERWDKSGHLQRMRESGRFRYVKEIVLHHAEPGSAERLVGLWLSQGGVATLLKRGMTEDEIGLPPFRAEAERVLGTGLAPWYWSYRVRFGVR